MIRAWAPLLLSLSLVFCVGNAYGAKREFDIKFMSYNLFYESLWYFFGAGAIPNQADLDNIDWNQCDPDSESYEPENCGASRLVDNAQLREMDGWRSRYTYLLGEDNEAVNAEKRWENRRQMVRKILAQEEPDIIALQEVNIVDMENFVRGTLLCSDEHYKCFGLEEENCSQVMVDPDELLSMAPCSDLKQYGSQAAMSDGDRRGVYVLFRQDRFERVEGGAIYAPDAEQYVRPAVWVHLVDRLTGRDFVALSTQASASNSLERVMLALSIRERVLLWHELEIPVVALGDFNTWNTSCGTSEHDTIIKSNPEDNTVSEADYKPSNLTDAIDALGLGELLSLSALVDADLSLADLGYSGGLPLSPSSHIYQTELVDVFAEAFDSPDQLEPGCEPSTAMKMAELVDGCEVGGEVSCVREIPNRRVDRVFASEGFEIGDLDILNRTSDEYWNGPMPIDRLLDGQYDCNQVPDSCVGKVGVYSSDHYPLVANLRLLPQWTTTVGRLRSYTVSDGVLQFDLEDTPELCESIVPAAGDRSVGLILPTVMTSSDQRSAMHSLFNELMDQKYEGASSELVVYAMPNNSVLNPDGPHSGCIVTALAFR